MSKPLIDLSQVSPSQQDELIERMAKAIAQASGYEVGNFDLLAHAHFNSHAAKFVEAAKQALAEVERSVF